MIKYLVLALAFISLISCNKKTSDEAPTDSSDGATSDLLQSSVGLVGDVIASSGVSVMSEGEVGPLAACSFGGFSNCSSGVRSKSWGTCTMGTSNSVTLDGTITHTHSDTSTCGMSTGGNYFTRSFSGNVATLANGFKIITYSGPETNLGGKDIGSADIVDYTGTNRFGGVTVTSGGAGSRVITISGVHRRGIRTDGNFGFWHTTFTDSGSPLSVNVSGTQYTIASGTVNTTYNRLRKTASVSFSNVVYDSTAACCYPVSGTISTSIDSGTAVSTTFTSTCGEVTIDGTATTLPACGGGSGQ